MSGTNMLSLVLTLLKFISIFSTGLFGIVGLLHDFKDDDKRMTKWGRVALVGIVLSGVTAAATEIVLVFKARSQEITEASQRKEVLARIDVTTTQSKNVLQETARLLHPIENLRVSFSAELPI